VNLVILGFLSSLIIDNDFILCNGKMLFTSGYIILSFCFVTGVLINISRLYDFRLTAKIARIREKDSNDEKLSSLRERTERIGKLTWIIFWGQIFLFSTGLVSILISFITNYKDKIF